MWIDLQTFCVEQFRTVFTPCGRSVFLALEGAYFFPASSDATHGVFGMAKKSPAPKKTKKRTKVAHPGMMGDGTEEQNLGQRGNPAARIKKKEVVAAFGKPRRKK